MEPSSVFRRLTMLRNLEFFNIFFLPLMLLFVLTRLQVENWQPYVYSMFIICFVLAQGVYFWHLKLRQAKERTPLPGSFYQIFSTFKIIDLILIIGFILCGFFNSMIPGLGFKVTLWSGLLFLFAFLEFINYYYYQLSHDSKNDLRYLLQHKRLRRSLLYRDMKKMEGAVKSTTP